MSWFKLLTSAAIGAPVILTFVDTVGYVATVCGASMQPTLNPDLNTTDFVFLNKWSVRNYEVERGDVVSLLSPKDPDQKMIKRIIGLEGDVIRTRKKAVVDIPKGHCWVEGDNGNQSHDSNDLGPVPIGLILSKATRIVWPPERMGKLVREDIHDDRFIVKQNPKVTLFPNP